MVSDISKIRTLIAERHYGEAITACEKLLEISPNQSIQAFRALASVYARTGAYTEEAKYRQKVLDSDEVSIQDFYLAAENALKRGEYEKATILFGQVLTLSAELNESWFLAGTYFLLAYAYLNMDDFDQALQYLDLAADQDPDISMPLPGKKGMSSNHELREEIERALRA
jgi:tetratricopeptide (TPR) repeat protein